VRKRRSSGSARDRIRYAAASGLLAFSGVAAGAVVSQMDVHQDGDCYVVTAVAHLVAPPDKVYAALLDFDRFTRIYPPVRKSTVLSRPDERTTLVYMETRGCVLFFCRTVTQVQQFEAASPRDIVAFTLPGSGNLRESTSTWHVEADAGGTQVTWRLVLDPDFWIPPFIGGPLLMHYLKRLGQKSMDDIELYVQPAAAVHAP